MWFLKYTGQFKKDLKRYQNQPKKIESLTKILTFLEKTGCVPAEFKPHMLKGAYTGFMECHVENDLLLIWLDETVNQITLTRLGTHSELFKK
ncbi:MAG: type II toxin-antitoxin system YafQ family toxin [Candidatus Cryptobacteroides sp.]|nr:type II toxin-antitoxin system YafQ family toxin [Candidatus Cryptobacteroides sp.]